MNMRALCINLGWVVLLPLGCTPRDKEEAATLITAVERVRAAPNEAKASQVPALEAAPCSDASLCETKKECVTFAKSTVQGLALKAEVERALADVKSGKLKADDPAAQALPGKLDDASRALKDGEAALLRCDERLVRLKREQRL